MKIYHNGQPAFGKKAILYQIPCVIVGFIFIYFALKYDINAILFYVILIILGFAYLFIGLIMDAKREEKEAEKIRKKLEEEKKYSKYN